MSGEEATHFGLRAMEILDIILREETGQVAIGNRWYVRLHQRQAPDPISPPPCVGAPAQCTRAQNPIQP